MTNIKSSVELGFIEKIESWKLKSKYFPCKVGGFPSWLALDSLPTENEIQCIKCKKPSVFLCQIYAPITSKDSCFHRTFFVFVCRDGRCNSDNDVSNIKVFRSQLPRENSFYSFEPPKEIEKDSDKPSASDFVKLCRICGCFGPKACSSCKLVTYCSRDHQGLDWKKGHKLECKSKELAIQTSAASPQVPVLFPEYEIDLEPEELEDNVEKTEEDVMADYESMLRKGQHAQQSDHEPELDDKDLIKMASKETDKQFAKFRTRIDPYADQVIRYERGGLPLFVSSENQPKDLPSCEECGEERKFEFQIMPQLLVHLKVDSVKPGASIDWGTVIVYTCPNSCAKEGVSYVQEVAVKQDYTPTTDFLKQ